MPPSRPSQRGGLPGTDAGTVTVHVPLAFRQRRGRKVLVAPDGAGQAALRAPQSPTRTRHEVTPVLRALARAFRWRKLMESGAMANVADIAAAERVNQSYVSRVLRLTLLDPHYIEALIETAPEGDLPSMVQLMKPFAIEWGQQSIGP